MLRSAANICVQLRKPSQIRTLEAYPHLYDAEYETIRGCSNCGKKIQQQHKAGETVDAFSLKKTAFLKLHKACGLFPIGQGKPPPKE